ncbi:hypothetical protein SprV_1002813100 [Sparganum proliferum]
MRMYFLDTYSTTSSLIIQTRGLSVAPLAVIGTVFALLVLLFLVFLVWRVCQRGSHVVLISEDSLMGDTFSSSQ